MPNGASYDSVIDFQAVGEPFSAPLAEVIE
jgi:hypothetical protein